MSTNASLKHEVVLLTGVTGLVGSSVIVALVKSKANLRFVCLVRSSGGISAKDTLACNDLTLCGWLFCATQSIPYFEGRYFRSPIGLNLNSSVGLPADAAFAA